MKLPTATRIILLCLAILVIGVVGWMWYQDAQQIPPGENTPPREIVDTVDRGLSEEEMTTQRQRIADLEAEMASKERDISLILQLGNLYYGIGELKTAIEKYDDILSTNPNDPPALENKGQAQLERGDIEGALASWEKAVSVSPYEVTYIRIANLISEHLPAQQQMIQPLLENAISTIGQTPALLARLARWYEENDMLEEAISHYEVASKLDPNNQALKDEIARLRAELTAQLQGGRDD